MGLRATVPSCTCSLLIALWLQAHTNGGKLRYEYSSGRQRGHLVCERTVE